MEIYTQWPQVTSHGKSSSTANLYFLFFKFIYFNWRLITLQYCSGFCHTLTWISHGCTCVPHPEPPLPSPSRSHPSGSSQCTGPEPAVSCIEPGLAICFTYDNIHVSMLFFQMIPPICRSPGFNPWVGKTPWRRERLPTPVLCLENSMDCIVLGVAKSRTRLSDFHQYSDLYNQSLQN